MTPTSTLIIIAIAVNIIGLYLIWRRLAKVEATLSTKADKTNELINQYGQHVGEYIDAMEDKKQT